jgi:hypothetical protein
VLWLLSSEFRDQIDADIEELVEESIDTLTTQVGRLNLLIAERMKSISADLATAELCVGCPRCRQPALMVLTDGPARCAFCLWRPIDGDECASEYVHVLLGQDQYSAVMDGSMWPIHPCVSCSESSMVEGVLQLLPDPASTKQLPAYFACFSCGWSADRTELDHCSRCSEITETSGDTGVPVCSNCWSHIVHD